MKKRISILLLVSLICCTTFNSCGSTITKEEYQAVVSEKDQIESQNAKTKKDYDKLQDEFDKLNNDQEKLKQEYESLKKDYEDYREKMKPFEELDAAEAEARKIEADAKKKQAEEEEKARKQAEEEEKARKAEEERRIAEEKARIGYETGITYEQLARNPEDYKGEKVKFYGKVIQVIEGTDEIQIRLAIDSNYDTVAYCGYNPSIVSSRVLNDDLITIYGISVGTISYESTLGGKITIPGIAVEKIEFS
ncbi:coiled-coil domain-containing protein [Ruminococcus flavefaciens]|uniref:coiled-coil domain-containing protein n=1 Tax=Ruminococcus flavefaciens TaxID=1265 RepID=UPI0004BA423F|nr:hypothetical protein [Ruminococcus flavefaciens]